MQYRTFQNVLKVSREGMMNKQRKIEKIPGNQGKSNKDRQHSQDSFNSELEVKL